MPERTLKTLERLVSKAGLGSRTQARKWIAAGRVSVNGHVVRDPDQWLDPERARILFDGKPLGGDRKRYILLYKPTGYLTTRRDPGGRPTVYDLIADLGQWVAPVGRLDQDTSGLLLLSSDTEFVERLTNPAYKAPKTYLVKAADVLSEEQLERLRRGVELKDGLTQPAEVKRLRDSARHTFFELTIREGRNRQVRRMVEAVGSHVLKLVRTGIGGLEISGLPIGKWRELTAAEIRALLRATSRP
ncbi:MAG TPA: pseudouridine synthase [Bryobacteraceae bacterium]|nr:pseudouridine synthase [Bryobacteraceae bacterium]